MVIEISDQEFARFQGFIFEAAGITLGPSKKALVSGRLEKRLRHHRLQSYSEYLSLLASQSNPEEIQQAIDLLTTNETYFFREQRHFELLRERAEAARKQRRPLRVWSAACSTGEEPYSIAMVLAELQADLPWELLASDISTKVLKRARIGHYPESRTTQIPLELRKRFCLKGTGEHAGTMLVERGLRQRVNFMQINLDRPLPAIGNFDLIFLRNVMIYFSTDTKRRVVARLLPQLREDGLLLVGHSETLNDVSDDVVALRPSIYQRR
ncbi:protein-glutamate O-methyltransferase CheR [Pelomonas sp. SE-A7]|uniref:CheR family methyltransferase n=1 Tax=Pelomonas sp. SE-A7 TaxID=3054953 RepID=UPI00259D1213|nr:protein-glutamate O-methyltransferase CheR [Pelomonas sp. SE-A7]MDM4766908.1 protein-glutamate O-methyltransferase CheR [Pelomonas sp. SE-A7]